MIVFFISAAATERQMVVAASKNLPAGFPAVQALDSGKLQTDAEIDRFMAGISVEPCVFLVRVLGGKSYFEHGFARLRDFCRERNRYLIALPGDQNPDAELDAISNVPLAAAAKAFQYALASGIENYGNLLRYLSDVFLSTTFGFEGPAPMPDAGLYHPDAIDRGACANLSLEEFQARYWWEGRPAIAILFYRAYWQSGDLAVVDGLAREIEARGYNVLPVFCYSLREESAKAASNNIFSRYFVNDSGPAVDCVISLFSYAVAELLREERTTTAGGQMAAYLSTLAIPFVQAITTSLTVSAWQESASGLPPWDAATKVVMPEFDGRIIGPVVGFRQEGENGNATSGTESYTVGLASRIRACVDLATRYSILRRKPNAEKRLALILTNFANRHGRIGSAVGLDTPASVVSLMKELRERGYHVTNIPESGDALMDELIALGGYDREYLTEDQMRLSKAGYTSAEYEGWFSKFPAATQATLNEE
ncbi:MAG TPA: cobaltochelatase subunit CobN, partial [Blastocatellia bacterium]